VKADLRAYEWPVWLYNTAGAAVPWERILAAANQVYKLVDGVNRCCFDLGTGGPGDEPRFAPLAATVTRARLDRLREADHFVMQGLERHSLMRTIWQCPTVALPISTNGRGEELIIARPVHSERAMTAQPAALPEALIGRLRDQILALPGVGGLGLDVTTKPPGTIEWE
jgi:GMP synthase PP-ATPase subunit